MSKINEQIAYAKKAFKDFVADFKQFDGLSTLNWRNKNRSGNYYVRYVFDENQNNLYISGDLGSACVSLTEKATLKTLSRYINMVNYFVEKIECSTDKYSYDYAMAREELEGKLFDPDEECSEEEQEELHELMDDLMDCLDRVFGWRLTQYVEDRLVDIDADYQEWIYNTGKYVDTRVILWLVGLNMAWEQIKTARKE